MLKNALKAFFDHFESYLCQFLLVFFVLVVFLQIVLRQINMSLSWTEEIFGSFCLVLAMQPVFAH